MKLTDELFTEYKSLFHEERKMTSYEQARADEIIKLVDDRGKNVLGQWHVSEMRRIANGQANALLEFFDGLFTVPEDLN